VSAANHGTVSAPSNSTSRGVRDPFGDVPARLRAGAYADRSLRSDRFNLTGSRGSTQPRDLVKGEDHGTLDGRSETRWLRAVLLLEVAPLNSVAICRADAGKGDRLVRTPSDLSAKWPLSGAPEWKMIDWGFGEELMRVRTAARLPSSLGLLAVLLLVLAVRWLRSLQATSALGSSLRLLRLSAPLLPIAEPKTQSAGSSAHSESVLHLISSRLSTLCERL